MSSTPPGKLLGALRPFCHQNVCQVQCAVSLLQPS